MELFWVSITIALLVLTLFMYVRTAGILNRMDGMIENAINHTFSEEEFTEQRLSRLESKMYRYLSQGETARRQAMEEKDAVKTLVSDISHQTKTPIANILLYTQLLGEAEELDDHARELISQTLYQTEKLDFLIQSLVKLSRLENGIVAVAPKENNVGELISAIDYAETAGAKGVALVRKEPPEVNAVFDFKWTLEAVSNLVDNAIKYTPEGGRVTISAQEYEMFVRIDISDTGIGMTEEETAKIFARFYRSPRVAEEKGVGIGLYLAREIITKEGGYIRVHSELGKGSEFSVFLAKRSNLSKL